MCWRTLILALFLQAGCIKASSPGPSPADSQPSETSVQDMHHETEVIQSDLPLDTENDTPDGLHDTHAIPSDVLPVVDTKPVEDIQDTVPDITEETQSPLDDASPSPEDTIVVPADTAQTPEDTGVDAGPEPITDFELAEHWAPVFYHDTDDKDYEADYITAFDFDGDFISDNNWENLHEPGANMGAVVYYSVVSTLSHHFILYVDFHARDWGKNCNVPFFGGCHENDMEGAMVVVRRSDEDPMGTFELLYTEAHNILHIFRNDPNIAMKWNLHVENVNVTFEDGSHPELYVESKGHGVCALYFSGPDHCTHSLDGTPPPFGGDDGVVYRYGATAGVPESGNDQHVPYKLKPIKDTLWERRTDICDSGCTFDTTFEYDGVVLPKAFDGDTYGNDAANPPWAWDDPADGPVYRGDFFFRPAHAMDQHVSMPGYISKTYVVNPFLYDL
jgi:hypothetical protein